MSKEMKPAFVELRRGKSAFAKGIITANHAQYANTDEINLGAVPLFRVVRVVRGQHLLPDKVEKNGISPKIQFVRLPFPAASQSVAVSSSDCWDGGTKGNWHPKRRRPKSRTFPRISGFFRLIPRNPGGPLARPVLVCLRPNRNKSNRQHWKHWQHSWTQTGNWKQILALCGLQ